MWQDYIAITPAALAATIGVLAVVIPNRPRTRGVIVAGLSVLAIVAMIWSQQIKSAEHARWHAIREQLGSFEAEGTELKRQCFNNPPPSQAASDWAARIETFLEKELGHSYVVRFRSSSGLMPISAPVQITTTVGQNLWEAINYRIARLDEFSRELPH